MTIALEILAIVAAGAAGAIVMAVAIELAYRRQRQPRRRGAFDLE